MAVAASPKLPPLESRVRVRGPVLMRQVGEEMVMLDLDRERYYGLNEVGARVMQLAESGASLEEISARLFEEFDAARDKIDNDVRRLAAELIAAGLLERERAK